MVTCGGTILPSTPFARWLPHDANTCSHKRRSGSTFDLQDPFGPSRCPRRRLVIFGGWVTPDIFRTGQGRHPPPRFLPPGSSPLRRGARPGTFHHRREISRSLSPALRRASPFPVGSDARNTFMTTFTRTRDRAPPAMAARPSHSRRSFQAAAPRQLLRLEDPRTRVPRPSRAILARARLSAREFVRSNTLFLITSCPQDRRGLFHTCFSGISTGCPQPPPRDDSTRDTHYRHYFCLSF